MPVFDTEDLSRRDRLPLTELVTLTTIIKQAPSSESLPPGDMKTEALAFLHCSDLHQILRKEILFGLIPKTVQGLVDSMIIYLI